MLPAAIAAASDEFCNETMSTESGSGNPKAVTIEEIIDRKGLNWYGMPKLKIFGNVLFAETDLFINLSTSADFTHSFISAVSKAKMKIGAADYPGNPFDIIMTEKHEIQEDEGTETVRNERTGDKIEAILKFIGQII